MSTSMQQSFYSCARLFWVGVLLLFLYYIADSTMDALLFEEGTVAEQLFSPNRHELAIRILSGSFLFLFFLYARHICTKKQILQQQLLNINQELITANYERDAFTHAFSHEMRTSLTCIYAAEQLLSEQCNIEKCSENEELLTYIHNSCEKMSKQIDEVLDLSKALRAKIKLQRVSFNKIAQEVALEVIEGVNDITVSIEIQRNLFFNCDPDLMRLAIKNLCLNAVEFSRPDKEAALSIGAEIRNGKKTFFVRRNDRNFNLNGNINLFNRPEQESEFQNTMIKHSGLASVRTIIERHGGEIWSENSKEVGSAFCFTL